MKTSRRMFSLGLAASLLAVTACANPPAPPITAIAFAPGGSHIVAGSQAGLSLRDPRSAAVVKTIDVGMDNLHDLQFFSSGQMLLVAGGNPGETGVVEIRDWPTLDRTQRLLLHDDVIYDVDVAADDSYWVAAGDRVCSLFAVGREDPVVQFTRHSRDALGVAFLPSGNSIVSCSRDQTLRVWSTQTGENLRTLHNHSRDVLALAVKPTTSGLPLVASASSDLTVRLWQPTIGRMVRFARLSSIPLCIAWCGDELIAGCRDGSARLIDPTTVQVTRELPICNGWLHAVAVDPANDRRIAFGAGDGQVIVVDLAIGAGGETDD